MLKRVRQDDTLMLAVRDNCINIYYRGGNLLRVRQGKGYYEAFFDARYDKSDMPLSIPPKTITTQKDVKEWVAAFPHLKEVMDAYFSIRTKPEREFQQLVARENNQSTISNESEYFIADIESNDSILGARFDMLGIRWLASQRKNGARCIPALIEMKYGDGALDSEAGLMKHLRDIRTLVTDKGKYQDLLKSMESQFNQLGDLGLLRFNRSSNGTRVMLDPNQKPEVIFILANHNPRSRRLASILEQEEMARYGREEDFYLRFFVSSFCGYGLHADCLLNLSQFGSLQKKWTSKKKGGIHTSAHRKRCCTGLGQGTRDN